MFKSTKKQIAILVLFLFTLLAATSTVLATTYVGSAKSDKFHYTDCRAAKRIKQGNLVYFYSREEALNAGYIQSMRYLSSVMSKPPYRWLIYYT